MVFKPYDAVYSKLTYSGKGSEVEQLDKERDMAFSNIKDFLNGYRRLPSAPNHQDASHLYEVGCSGSIYIA